MKSKLNVDSSQDIQIHFAVMLSSSSFYCPIINNLYKMSHYWSIMTAEETKKVSILSNYSS